MNMADKPDFNSENAVPGVKKPMISLYIPKQLQYVRPEIEAGNIERLEKLATAARTAMVNL